MDNSAELILDHKSKRVLSVHTARVALNILLLIVAIFLQSLQPEFFNPDVWVPLLGVLAVGFLTNIIFFLFLDNQILNKYINGVLFGYDTLIVTSLVYLTGINQSVFIFLYLVNIILCGLVFKRRGALLLSLWTSILFSVLLIFTLENGAKSIYFIVVMNNLAFFAIAFLGGMLSEQMDFIGGELVKRNREFGDLKNLNKLITDSMSMGLISSLGSHELVYNNEAAEKILGKNIVIGESIANIFPDIIEQIESKFNQKNLDSNFRFEIQYEKNKDKLILEVVVSSIPGGDKTSNGYIYLFEDKTEIKRLEYNMRQKEKLAAVGQLAAGIAHEIRNPLASISGSIQLLSDSDDLSLSSDDAKLFKITLKEIDRLNNLISEFLDYVKPDRLIADPINLKQLFDEIFVLLKNQKEINQSLTKKIQMPDDLIVKGDFSKLKQALLNIIINAIQAMNKVEDPVLKVSARKNNNKLFLEISDNGVGIDEFNIKKVFEPFHTTKDKGTGLGMAMTHKILEAHRAKVYIESEVGTGTKFIIEFLN